MRRDAEQLLASAQRAWGWKANWYGLHALCYEFAMPGEDVYTTGGGPGAIPMRSPGGNAGRPQNLRVYDSTLASTATRLSNRIVSGLFPHGQKWARFLPPRSLEGDERHNAQTVLQQLENRLFQLIEASDFHLGVSEAVQEMVVAGTGTISPRADWDGRLAFQSTSQIELAFEADGEGKVIGMFRKLEFSRQDILERWPQAKPPADPTPETAKRGQPHTWRLMHCCYLDRSLTERRWRQAVVIESEDASARQIVWEDRFETPAWIIGRWIRRVGEVHGRSPVMAALPSFLSLNKAVEYLLKNASLRVSGAFAVRRGEFHTPNAFQIRPGAKIPVDYPGGPNPSIVPLQVGGDLQMSSFVIQDSRQQVEQIMLSDRLPPDSGAVRSASEIIERVKRLQEDLGPPVLRVLTEFGLPLLQGMIEIMKQTNDPIMELLDSVGAGNIRIDDGKMVEVAFTGPLAKVIALAEVENLTMFLESSALAGEAAMAGGVKLEEIPAWIALQLSIPTELIRSPSERQELAKMKAEGMAGQMQMAAAGAQPPAPGGPQQ